MSNNCDVGKVTKYITKASDLGLSTLAWESEKFISFVSVIGDEGILYRVIVNIVILLTITSSCYSKPF